MGLYDNDSEAVETKTESAPTVAPVGAPAPKRRGRPPGSKNRPKDGSAPASASDGKASVPIDMGALPDEIVEPLALAPLIIVRGAIEAKTTERDARGAIQKRGIVLQYDEKAVIASVAAFRKWLSSIDLNLSPGYAYLACMAVAFGSAAPMFFTEMSERTKEKRGEKRVNSEATTAPKSEGANNENATGTASASDENGGSASANSAS